jgi:sec-independent protein translocase protein TatA
MFKSIGPTELIIIAVVLLLLFGGKKIPEFFRGIVESIREFKRSSKETSDDVEKHS